MVALEDVLQPPAMTRADDEQVGALGLGDMTQGAGGREIGCTWTMASGASSSRTAPARARVRALLGVVPGNGSGGLWWTPTSTSRAPVAEAMACASETAPRPRSKPLHPATMVRYIGSPWLHGRRLLAVLIVR